MSVEENGGAGLRVDVRRDRLTFSASEEKVALKPGSVELIMTEAWTEENHVRNEKIFEKQQNKVKTALEYNSHFWGKMYLIKSNTKNRHLERQSKKKKIE